MLFVCWSTIAGSTRVLVGIEEVNSELCIYEKVLHVLSAEMARLQDLMLKSQDYQQQQKAKLDSLRNTVSDFKQAGN